MPKTITLRLSDRAYEAFAEYAAADNRAISNLIETAAMKHLQECSLASDAEMAEIRADARLVARLRQGSHAARARKGRFAR